MIRTNAVKLSSMPAYAYRQKLKAGDVGIVIVTADASQPGIASISKKTGEAIPLANTNTTLYPAEAFSEALSLTSGLPYRKQGGLKVTAEMVQETEEEEEEQEVTIDQAAYQKILDHYTDKNGKLSYDLINKKMIQFAKRSSIVRKMVEEGRKASEISRYIVYNKLRNTAGNLDMPDKEVAALIELLDALDPKSIFKELNKEIRAMLGKSKK